MVLEYKNGKYYKNKKEIDFSEFKTLQNQVMSSITITEEDFIDTQNNE